MRKTIVAIGGGDLKSGGTLPIDKEIMRLTGKRSPNALFIPTASNDSPAYWESFKKIYGKKLGCQTDVLFLISEQPSSREIARKINEADLIYVGGGNTLNMMRVWRRTGVDKLLARAYKKGTVLSGLSAGAVCWFKYGHSDSPKFYKTPRDAFMRVRGLGLISATFCPHYLAEKRDASFKEMMAKYGGLGLAADNNAALIIEDEEIRAFTSESQSTAVAIIKSVILSLNPD